MHTPRMHRAHTVHAHTAHAPPSIHRAHTVHAHTAHTPFTHRACTPRRPLGSFSERAAAKSELRTQIRLSQSHPAITAWLIGNEANGPWQQVRVRVGEP